MRKNYAAKSLLYISVAFLLMAVASCKKDSPGSKTTTNVDVVPDATPTKLGLFEADTAIYKILFMDISQVGTKTVDYDLIFDTGSGGLVLDATDIIPKSMISSTGFTFTGDSVVVNGITITNQTSMIEYGGDSSSTTKVYGNLAYASVTIGETDGNMVIKRLPFFLYYKGVDTDGKTAEAHEFDILGVNPEYDVTFNNNAFITSPFSYFVPGKGLTAGFKMAALGTGNFTSDGAYVPNVVTLGLTKADLSSSGFVMSSLRFYPGEGYDPLLPATVTYGNGITTSTDVLFDTGTEPYSYIENDKATKAVTLLPQSTSVSLATTSGFNYTYTTSEVENLTYIENASTGITFSIFGIEFFLNNEYLLDFTNHQLGVKNN